MKKFNPHIGAAHSNYRFGLPTPRDARSAFGHSLDAGQSRPADAWVFWLVVLSALLAWAFG